MSQYKSSWPASQQHDPAYVSFFEKFYQVSDTPDAHDEYADSFTPDATVIMASKKVEGRDGYFPLTSYPWRPRRPKKADGVHAYALQIF
ncbi:hypothetical protein C1H76_0025 [Elsinoe australis]|uniref:Uncharacterized protein n=1 Tax=Elsinoe australis TaxID=40998 RepID=A0A4U7BBQ8_9PEZI|nr:hypothetical protein C1H76_0025 [Elsinoe australis]